jgi:uncharacterized paraquat-inducible protein A
MKNNLACPSCNQQATTFRVKHGLTGLAKCSHCGVLLEVAHNNSLYFGLFLFSSFLFMAAVHYLPVVPKGVVWLPFLLPIWHLYLALTRPFKMVDK